jgi:hypothetical protein
LFRALAALKNKNTALHNGPWGARMIRVGNDSPREVLSFVRENARDKVLAVFNFSPTARSVRITDALGHGTYVDFFEGERLRIDATSTIDLPAWGYAVLER